MTAASDIWPPEAREAAALRLLRARGFVDERGPAYDTAWALAMADAGAVLEELAPFLAAKMAAAEQADAAVATDPNGWPNPEHPGAPLHPERGGWHWLRDDERRATEQVFVARWHFDAWAKRWYWDTGSLVRAEYAGKEWHYLGPCLLPVEVAEIKAQAKREGMREAAALVDCGCPQNIKDAVTGNPPNSGARWNACGQTNCGAIEAAAIERAAREGGE